MSHQKSERESHVELIKNGRENITHRAQIFVMHDFKKFSLNTFDTLKRSKGAQILRLIMTIDLN